MDPAALGTLRIGLDTVAAKARHDRLPARHAVTTRTTVRRRAALASVLRRAADALEPRALREANT